MFQHHSPLEACYWQISVDELFVLGSQSVTFLTCQSSAVCFPSSTSWCVWRWVSLCLRWHSDCDDSNLRIHIDTPRGKELGLVGRLTSPWCLVIGYLTDASFHAQRLTKYTYHRRSPGVKLPAQGHSGATSQVISLPLLGPATDFNWTYSKLTLTGRVIFYIWHVKLLTNSMNLWQVQWIVYPQKNSLLQMEMDFVSYPVSFLCTICIWRSVGGQWPWHLRLALVSWYRPSSEI